MKWSSHDHFTFQIKLVHFHQVYLVHFTSKIIFSELLHQIKKHSTDFRKSIQRAIDQYTNIGTCLIIKSNT